MFGVVGIPVTEIALAAQEVGIKYIGMRNEQAVSLLTQGPNGSCSMHTASHRF